MGKKSMKRGLLLASVVGLMLVAAACGNAKPAEEASPAPGSAAPSAPAQNTPAAPAPEATAPAPAAPETTPSAAAIDAETIVKQSCIGCHGDTLDGKGSANKNLQKVGAKLTKEQITAQISDGGGGMPGFKEKLKPEEIAAISEWLAAKK